MIAQKPTLAAPAMPLRPRLWVRMLSMLTAQLPLILRLVAIAMTLTTDASGCERLISLIMSDLQTEFHSGWHLDPNGPAHAARRPTACCALTVVARVR